MSAVIRDLPTGTVTFLFTDIEGSTRLLATLGDDYDPILARHSAIVRACLDDHEGVEVNTEGDAFFAAFASASDAVAAATTAQTKLAAEDWPAEVEVRVRMGLHTGEGRLGGANYSGLDVNRAARISACGHGGQVIVSDATRSLIGADHDRRISLRDLGRHQLKDLPEVEQLWQVDVDGLAAEFPPLRTLTVRRGNVPTAPSALVGRHEEVQVVREHLSTRSLVTLTGPGGTGKTRLALAVAELEEPSYADGAWFADLAAATDRAGVVAAVAATLGAREMPDRDLEASLFAYLRDRRLLLVLDNLEQALSAAPLIGDILASAPDVSLLVTSRSALRVRGEQEFSVPPLAEEASVEMFVERAVAVRPDFELNEENTDAVAGICRRLDGLPLAVELAAARVRLLAPQAILDRLDQRLPMLTDSGRDRPERQQTLSATIAWSYELLSPDERRLFARLSVFAGGWELDAAEQVCQAREELGIDLVDGLSALVEQSLVRPPTHEGVEPRFAMLQVVREYASDRLAEDASAAMVAKRHAEVMAELVEAAEHELLRQDLRTWQRHLLAEEDNVRAALRWAIDASETRIALRIAGCLWRFWQYWARINEGISWVTAALEMAPEEGDDADRARALTALAALVYWRSEHDRSDAIYLDAIAIYRKRQDDHLLGMTLADAIFSAMGKGDTDAAKAQAQEALGLLDAAGDAAGAETVRAWQAYMANVEDEGDSIDEALAAAIRAVEVNRADGRVHFASELLALVVRIERLSGRYDDARRHLREVLTVFSELGNVGRLPSVFLVFAALEIATDHPDRAARLGSAAAHYADDFGTSLSSTFLRTGDPVEESRALLSEEQHAREVELGRTMTVDEIVAFALAG